jgi:cobalt/nickel transport system permease protein
MLDHFAAGQTPAHRFDPAAKTLAALAMILTVVLVGRDHFWPLLPVACALAAYHAVSRLPVRYALKRLLVISPAAVAVAALFPLLEPGSAVWSMDFAGHTLQVTDTGLLRAAGLVCKFLLAAWAALLLLSTTRFQAMLQALTRLRVPRALVVQLAFLYRYLWVMADEVMRLRMARTARDGGAGPWRLRMQSRTALVGVLFLRTWDRAERIYWAMAARGFDGSLQTASAGRLRAADWLLALGAIVGGAAILVWDRLAYA